MLRVFEDGTRNPHGSSSSADYAQLCKSLLDLQKAADKVFDTVADRVGVEHQRLKGLSSRIRTAKAKIDSISGTKRAITIRSSSRYPSTSSDVEDFRPLFGGKFGGGRTNFPVATLSLNGGLSRDSGEDGTLELFRFFSETSHEYFSYDKNRKVGLGNMPSDTNSVADILLFNSTELPYHRYKRVDNLVVGEPCIEESLELKHAPLPPPPQSVLQGRKLLSTRSEEFSFRPTVRQVPSLSLPSSLPDLPMVADISWSGDKSIHAVEQNANFKEITPPPPPPPPPPPLTPPPPPPPPPPLPPPPPPPPPPPQHAAPAPATPPLTSSSRSPISVQKEKYIQEPKAPTTEADYTSSKSFVPQIDSQREALMTSIRNPGIALKKTGLLDCNSKTKDSTQTSDNFKQSENMSIHPKLKSVNLLAEVAASLKMRRLSMKGAAHDNDQLIEPDITSPSASSSKFTLP
ncbi:hypothetical protein KI387_016039, partial [Taxus chinensis]